MAITVYNTLTRSKDSLEPIEPGRISMYVCGPTVYDDCHIGHLMGPVLFDAVGRWLQARGHELRFVNNITDIDDKIINRSLSTGEEWQSVTARYTQQYFDFLAELHVTTITDHPRCSDYIPQMIAFIQKLVDNDRAYPAADGVYFDVTRQPGYGKLSGRKLEDTLSGARIDAQDGLRNPADFALWKAVKPGEPNWDSPWGAGRPGWHLECSVMSTEILGQRFDIHGGGDDLKFPHHENEIAQAEGCGCHYAAVWMHNGLIQYGGVKIAKSDPRMKDPAFAQQFKARFLLDTYGAPAVRFFLLQGHYRRPFDFDPSNIEAARTALARLHKQLGPLLEADGATDLDTICARALPDDCAKRREYFLAAMDDDFNTGKALGHLFAIASAAKKLSGAEQQACLETVRDLGRLLGLFIAGDAVEAADSAAGSEHLAGLMDLVIELRANARANRDFATADTIRDRLTALGISLTDGADGTAWAID
ncbi:MAG: cysteine--tRNA ligase [Planctomycetota bacterium]|jgi:cysteinyl-tRNA synthetase|nr:cysteine--tRNA ligase [Planctomycetota bacterium]